MCFPSHLFTIMDTSRFNQNPAPSYLARDYWYIQTMLNGAIPLRHGQAFQLSYDHLGIGGCSCTVHVYRVVEIIGPIHKVLVAIMIEEGQVVFAANIFQRLIHLVVMRVELWRNGKHQLGPIGFTCHNQLFQVMQLKRIVLIILLLMRGRFRLISC